jgi:outer membrane protein assembly factor BamE
MRVGQKNVPSPLRLSLKYTQFTPTTPGKSGTPQRPLKHRLPLIDKKFIVGHSSALPDPAMKRLLIAATLLAPLTLTGCSGSRYLDPNNLPFIYKIDVQQGNVVTQDMLAQLEPGMERSKVRFIMGTPAINDVFHQDRWDYIYTYQPGGGERTERRVSVYFEKDRLTRVSGDVKSAKSKLVPKPRQEVSVEVPEFEEPGLFSPLLEAVGLGDEKPVKRTDPSLEPAASATAETAEADKPEEADTTNAVTVERGIEERQGESENEATDQVAIAAPAAESERQTERRADDDTTEESVDAAVDDTSADAASDVDGGAQYDPLLAAGSPDPMEESEEGDEQDEEDDYGTDSAIYGDPTQPDAIGTY